MVAERLQKGVMVSDASCVAFVSFLLENMQNIMLEWNASLSSHTSRFVCSNKIRVVTAIIEDRQDRRW